MSENVMTDRAIIDNDNLAQPKNVLQPPKNSKNNPPSTIRVAVRVRPLNEKEKYISNFDTARVVDKNLLVLLDPQYEMSPDDHFRNNRNREKQYTFEYVFDDKAEQIDIYNQTTAPLVKSVLEGYNSTVFAYGATGAGKTYTMMGPENNPGVMKNALTDLFTSIESMKEKEGVVIISYIEVYNENIRDLLCAEDTQQDLREDPVKGIEIAGVSIIEAQDKSDIISMLTIGNKNRTMEPTLANEVSSRSHAVLLINVEMKEKEKIFTGRLTMIDLAGSERAAYTNNKGLRMIEGANINKSLLALGNCINALFEQQKEGNKDKMMYIPYRDSKQTRLLKDSLGGNCQTLMIAAISSSVSNYEDSLNTLKYASRTKEITTSVNKNFKNANTHVSKYAQLISKLKEENEELKTLLAKNHTEEKDNLVLESNGTHLGEDQKRKAEEQERLVLKHFQEEHEQNIKFYVCEDNIDNVKQTIARNYGESDEATKTYLGNLESQKAEMLSKNNELVEKRNLVLTEINKLDQKDFVHSYVNSLFLKEKMKLENLEIKRSETRNANVLKYRDWVIIFLKNQVMLRDNILLEQKFLLDKNAISNTISYTGLKVVDKIEEDPNQKPKDFVLPPIGSNRGIGNAQSMKINKKKPNGGQYQPTNNNRQGYMYPKSHQPSLSSKTGGQQGGYQQGSYKYKSNFNNTDDYDHRITKICNNILKIDARPNEYLQQQQKRGGYELPDYLKSRMKNNNMGGIENPRSKIGIKNNTAMNDRSQSYNRRLQNAIHQRNNQMFPGGVTSQERSRSNHGMSSVSRQRKKLGFNYSSQPHLRQQQKNIFDNMNKQVYVPNKYKMSANERLSAGGRSNNSNNNQGVYQNNYQRDNTVGANVNNTSHDENYKTPDALKLLNMKRKSNNDNSSQNQVQRPRDLS